MRNKSKRPVVDGQEPLPLSSVALQIQKALQENQTLQHSIRKRLQILATEKEANRKLAVKCMATLNNVYLLHKAENIPGDGYKKDNKYYAALAKQLQKVESLNVKEISDTEQVCIS